MERLRQRVSLEWQRKSIAFVGYGGVGAERAIEQLRGNAIELQMAPIKQDVNIAMEPFIEILRNGRSLDDDDHLVRSRIRCSTAWYGGVTR